jgi:hypothetical protein
MDGQEKKAPEQNSEPASTQSTTSAKDQNGGYGKRPLWQWILLYLVVGGVLYYVIYLLFFASSKTGGSYGY